MCVGRVLCFDSLLASFRLSTYRTAPVAFKRPATRLASTPFSYTARHVLAPSSSSPAILRQTLFKRSAILLELRTRQSDGRCRSCSYSRVAHRRQLGTFYTSGAHGVHLIIRYHSSTSTSRTRWSCIIVCLIIHSTLQLLLFG